MKRNFVYKIDSLSHGKTIEQFLKEKGYGQKLISALRRSDDGIFVDGKRVYTTYMLCEGDELAISIKEEESSEHVVPVFMKLDILYEDEDLMVINKASGVPIHPSQGNYENTLGNGIAYYFQEKGEHFVYRAINRLDRDTTGLLIVSKNRLSAGILSQMGAERKIKRTYLAIVEGKLEGEGVVDAPIARVADSTIERGVDFERGERAVTHYKVIQQNEKHSLVQLKLETGRTHQIRVHMKYIGHPLLGDFLYNPQNHDMSRQALHSWKLAFVHPITGELLEFEAPLPEDMRGILC